MLSRRAHKAVVYVFLGFLNVVGTVGDLIFYGNIGKEDQQPLGDSEQHLQVAGSYCHTGYTFQVNRIKILKMVTCDLEDFWVCDGIFDCPDGKSYCQAQGHKVRLERFLYLR